MKRSMFAIQFLALLVNAAGACLAQTADKPPQLADPLYYVGSATGAADYRWSLYPVGWSPDGKFAVVAASPEYAMMGTGPVYTYRIIDAVSGSDAWTQDDGAGGGLAVSWKRTFGAFTAALAKNGVAYGRGLDLLPFPLVTEEDGYSCVLGIKGKGAGRVMAVRLAAGGKGAKEIGSLADLSRKYFACGCFKSPYGQAVVAVIGIKGRVMDAGSELSFALCGATLDKGFTGKTGPAALAGTWLNEGELATLDLRADGTCQLRQGVAETPFVDTVNGRFSVTGNRVMVRWDPGKGEWAAAEYEYRATKKQKLLWLMAGFLRSSPLPEGGPFAFHRPGAAGTDSIKGNWASDGDQVSLSISDDMTCLLRYEEGESGKPRTVIGRAARKGDAVTITWGRDWWYGIETVFKYSTGAGGSQLLVTSFCGRADSVEPEGRFGFYKAAGGR